MNIETIEKPKKKISARIVADSINASNDRITTFILCYPRMIHAELMTHRAFSRNAASSRAIPIEKMIKEVYDNPAGPIRWGKNGSGMQDHGEMIGDEANAMKEWWAESSQLACRQAEKGSRLGGHKQIVNRVLEPFAWMETLVTATDFMNFFALRVHKDAQPEFQWLAYLMAKLYLAESELKFVEKGEWHMPFNDFMPPDITITEQLKIASARAARLSYKTFDGEMSPEKDYGIYNKLVGGVPGHWSPIEHPATPAEGRHGPYNGWKSYRAHHPNENITKLDLAQHIAEYEKEKGIVPEQMVA